MIAVTIANSAWWVWLLSVAIIGGPAVMFLVTEHRSARQDWPFPHADDPDTLGRPVFTMHKDPWKRERELARACRDAEKEFQR